MRIGPTPLAPEPEPPRPQRPAMNRRSWHLVAVAPVLLWAIAAVVAVLLQPVLPASRWLLVHAMGLGVAANAIIIWSSFFTDALLRTRRTGHRREALVLTVLNLGAVAVITAMLAGSTSWTVLGGALVVAAALIHGIGLWLQTRGALASRFAVTVRYYITAALMLPVGGWLGVEMVRSDGADFAGLLLAHLAVNLLGFVGLTVAGTLLSLWPTMLRTTIIEGAERAAARAWWLLTLGLLIMAGGSVLSAVWAMAAGVLIYLGGLGVVVVTMRRTAAVRPPSSLAPWSVAFGVAWWIGSLLALLIILGFAATMSEAITGARSLTLPFVVGFLAQVLVGALSYLLPVVLGGGPSVNRRTSALMDWGRWVRLVLINVGALTGLLAAPGLVTAVASSAVLVGFVTFLALVVRVIVAALRGKTAARPEAGQQEVLERRRRRAGLIALGVLGLAAAAAALDPVGWV